jgi:hypothetical protein
MGFFNDIWKAHPANQIFGSNPDAPQFQGIDALDQTAFGTETARENMGRYGFQGTYQKFLQSENIRMKDDEQRRIMKLASNLVPGMASFRGGVASQGLGGSTSNVIGKVQRDTAMGKALDVGMQEFDTSSNRLDSQFLTMTGQNETMRFGASQDLMKALQMHGMALQDVRKYNATGVNEQANKQWQSEIDSKDQWRQIFATGVGAAAGGGMNSGGMGRNTRPPQPDKRDYWNWT